MRLKLCGLVLVLALLVGCASNLGYKTDEGRECAREYENEAYQCSGGSLFGSECTRRLNSCYSYCKQMYE